MSQKRGKREDRRSLLKEVDGQDGPSVAGQRSSVGVADLSLLGPVLDHSDQWGKSRVALQIGADESAISHAKLALHAEIDLGGSMGQLDDGDTSGRDWCDLREGYRVKEGEIFGPAKKELYRPGFFSSSAATCSTTNEIHELRGLRILTLSSFEAS